MKKLFIAIGFLLLVLLVSGVAYFAYTATRTKESNMQETGTALPSTFQNPFVEKPTTGFSNTSSTILVSNLFAEPTPTPYQNPFGSTTANNQAYQNPFEQLK